MRTLLRLVGALAVAGSAAAQEPQEALSGATWLDVAYPKLYYSPRDGLTAGGYIAYLSPLGYADFDHPPPYRASFALSGQIATSGSREIGLEARLPELAHGWRFVGLLRAERLARENYFGIGNATTIDDARVSSAQPHYYQSLNVRLTGRGEVQRQVVGGLRLLVGVHAERWRIDTLPGASVLRSEQLAGLDPDVARGVNDMSARAGIIFDTRNDEVAPRSGVRAEFIHSVADASVAGDLTYTRTTATAAAYIPIGPQVVVAARVAGERMGGTPLVGSYYRMESSDRPYEALGGPSSHRALGTNRFLGRSKLLGNLDVRYDAYAIPTAVRVTLVGFLDAGRVFEPEPFRITTADLKVGSGAGLIVQLFRAAILGSTLGVGPDGMQLQVHTRWTY